MRSSSSPSARRGGMRSVRTGGPPWIARVALRLSSDMMPPLIQPDTMDDLRNAQTVRGQQIVVAAVIVDESVLQREGVETALRLDVPGDLLGLRRKPALRYMLLDDDDVLVVPKGGDDAVAVERLDRVSRDQRGRDAPRLKAVGEFGRHFGDDAVRQDADIGAAAQVAQLAEDPRLGALGQIRFARLADPQVNGAVLLPCAPARGLGAFRRVAGRDDLHVGYRAGDRDVFHR